MTPTQRWLADATERVLRTFLQGFLGVVTLDAVSTRFDATLREQLAAGALAGLYAVASSFAAKGFGAHDSASALPAHIDPPQGGPTDADYDDPPRL